MTTEQTFWVNTNGERHIATGDELQEILSAIAESDARKQAEELANAEKEAAKTAAQAKLTALGLTVDDLKALGL
jgi:hypothetical protein